MAIDFPASPSVNDIHTSGGKRWTWNGTSWERSGTPGPGDTISATNDNTTSTLYPVLVTGTGSNTAKIATTSSKSVSFNASNGNLTATTFTGTLNTAAQTNITSVGTLGSLNVTGNATIGGVLTYEDVKNVDSVGLITARAGIKVTGGVTELIKGTSGGATANTDAALIVDNSSHTYIQFRTPATKEQGLLFGDDADNDAGTIIYDHSDNVLTFGTNGTGEKLRITAGGQVRIANTTEVVSSGADDLVVGTTSGERGITILSGTSNTGNIYFGDTDTSGTGNRMGSIRYVHDGNYMRFSTNGNVEKVRITSAGLVGINSTSPTAQFEVLKSGTTGYIFRAMAGLTVGNRNYDLKPPSSDSVDEPFSWSTGNSHAFQVDGVERLRIAATGRVGIGSAIPAATLDLQSTDTEELLRLHTLPAKNGYLDISSDANRRGVIRFKDSDGTYRWSIGNGDSDELSNASFHISSGNSGGNTAKLVVTSNGAVVVAGTSAYSDGTFGEAKLQFNTKIGNHIGACSVADSTNNITHVLFKNPNGAIASVGTHNSDFVALTGNVERLRIDSGGRILTGGETGTNVSAGGIHVKTSNAGATTQALILENNNNNANTEVQIKMVASAATPDDRFNAITCVNVAGNNRMDTVFHTCPGGTPLERMRLDNEGRLLLGTTTTPVSNKCSLRAAYLGSTSSGNVIELTHQTNGADKAGAAFGLAIGNGGASTNAADLNFSTAISGSLNTRMTIKDSGNVGIGILNPLGVLEVQKNGVPAIIANYNNSKHIQMGAGSNGAGFHLTDGNFFTINHQPYANRGTDSNLTERFRIASDGDVTITATGDPTLKLIGSGHPQ